MSQYSWRFLRKRVQDSHQATLFVTDCFPDFHWLRSRTYGSRNNELLKKPE